MRENQGIVRSERLELVRRRLKRQAGQFRDAICHRLGKALLRIQSRADRRAALRQQIKPGERIADALAAERDLRGITGKLLAKRNRRCVLQMRAADLHDRGEFARFARQRILEPAERRQQTLVHRARRGDMHRGREGIVG